MALTALDVDLTVNVIHNNSEHFQVSNSSFKVDLNLTDDQEEFIESIKDSHSKTRDKCVQCINFLTS